MAIVEHLFWVIFSQIYTELNAALSTVLNTILPVYFIKKTFLRVKVFVMLTE